MRRLRSILALIIMACFMGCESSPPAPTPDVTSLSDAIKFVAVCGVITSIIWGGAIVWREYIKNKRPKD